jgi:hypothetical protein
MKFETTGEEAAVDYFMLHSDISLERLRKINSGCLWNGSLFPSAFLSQTNVL